MKLGGSPKAMGVWGPIRMLWCKRFAEWSRKTLIDKQKSPHDLCKLKLNHSQMIQTPKRWTSAILWGIAVAQLFASHLRCSERRFVTQCFICVSFVKDLHIGSSVVPARWNSPSREKTKSCCPHFEFQSLFGHAMLDEFGGLDNPRVASVDFDSEFLLDNLKCELSRSSRPVREVMRLRCRNDVL